MAEKVILGVEWIPGTGDFIKVVEESCNGCGDCVRVCLAKCFGLRRKKAYVKSLDNCFECAACWFVCLEDAIDFSWPNGGTGFRTEFG